MKNFRMMLMGCALALLVIHPAAAQDTQTRSLARAVAKACPGNWEDQSCLAAVSESTLVLAATYAGSLEGAGHTAATEPLKQHCAAATAATKGEYPAYAMKSAFIECANSITELAGQTGVAPDPTQYQLLVGPVLCLEKDGRCTAVEEGLRAFK